MLPRARLAAQIDRRTPLALPGSMGRVIDAYSPRCAAARLRFVPGFEGRRMAILEVRGLVKFYGRRKVVDGVDFDVDVGQVVGLLGPNGAGKTTSFRMTTGQVTPNAGQVLFAGNVVTTLPMYKRARLGMGYLSQETSVFRKLTVEQNILAILEVMPSYRSLGRKLTRAERHQKTTEVLDKFGLSHLRKNMAGRLSGGEKRRLEIARCLVCDPLLILLDEPFTGIDPQTIDDIKDIVRELRKQGIGILITDHQVREVLTVTDRSYLIKGGRVLTKGTPHELLNDAIAKREYFGNSLISEGLGGPNLPPPPPQPPHSPAASAAPERRPDEGKIHRIVEQEKLRRLIDAMWTSNPAVAAEELGKRVSVGIPALFEALERRDVDVRRHAWAVLQRFLGPGAEFDPYAPEAQRRQQLVHLRERMERKAG
jgi:lipopolysaccharide export system ATP-binding protein